MCVETWSSGLCDESAFGCWHVHPMLLDALCTAWNIWARHSAGNHGFCNVIVLPVSFLPAGSALFLVFAADQCQSGSCGRQRVCVLGPCISPLGHFDGRLHIGLFLFAEARRLVVWVVTLAGLVLT